VGAALSCVDVGIGIVGGAKAAFYHKVPPGYVEIEIAARGSAGRPSYVKPWVADLHYGVITAMFFAFIAGFCIFILIRMAKIVPENSNPQT
jgi:hypothetical protein